MNSDLQSLGAKWRRHIEEYLESQFQVDTQRSVAALASPDVIHREPVDMAEASGSIRAETRPSRWREALVATIAIFILTSCHYASAADGSGPTDFLGEALANVMASAHQVNNLSNYGYASGTCVLGAYLTVGATVTMDMEFGANTKYLILAGGDFDAGDIDVEVRDRDTNRLIASDRKQAPNAHVLLQLSKSGWYSITVGLHRSDAAGSFVAVAILEEGGFQVPLSHLGEAGGKMMAYSLLIAAGVAYEGQIASFQANPNQWALYGSILRSGQTNRVFNLRPGNGRQLFIAAADSTCEDLGLRLDANEPNIVVARDEDQDSTKLIDIQTTTGQSYGITTTMVQSTNNDYSLVLTAVLSVK